MIKLIRSIFQNPELEYRFIVTYQTTDQKPNGYKSNQFESMSEISIETTDTDAIIAFQRRYEGEEIQIVQDENGIQMT